MKEELTKLTYRDAHSLIWKIGQVALAVLLTLATLGLAFCFENGAIWRLALAHFKDRIVHQNSILQPAMQTGLASSLAPRLATIVPPVVQAVPLSPAHIALQLKKADIIKENPEYSNVVQAWEKRNVLYLIKLRG